MAKTKRNSKKKAKIWLGILIVFLLLILIVLGFAYNKLSKLNQADINEDNITINEFNNDDLKGYTNIAIFGVDSRQNELLNNTRSDTILIASINKKIKDVKLVSVYRDTYSDIEGVGYRKINAAYANGGPELAISTLNKHLDLDITDFVTVNFSAVTNVVDAIGGIEIDIDVVDDARYLRTDFYLDNGFDSSGSRYRFRYVAAQYRYGGNCELGR